MFDEVKRITGTKENHSILKTIKLLCIESNISIPSLEKALGFGNGSIYHWDKSFPAADKIIKVAIYFKVSANYILGLIEE
ncbi:MAG: XRE family transcriptional regulator [Cellulosilyticaceae bacterium]